MTTPEFDALQGRIIILENLVLELLSRQPDGAGIVQGFEAFSAQQIAMHAAIGSAPEQVASLRTALAELTSAAVQKSQP